MEIAHLLTLVACILQLYSFLSAEWAFHNMRGFLPVGAGTSKNLSQGRNTCLTYRGTATIATTCSDPSQIPLSSGAVTRNR